MGVSVHIKFKQMGVSALVIKPNYSQVKCSMEKIIHCDLRQWKTT